jgi:hypothetical protein
MCKVLILLEEKGVVRYAKMAAAVGTAVARHFGPQRRCFGYSKVARPMAFGAGHLLTAELSSAYCIGHFLHYGRKCARNADYGLLSQQQPDVA